MFKRRCPYCKEKINRQAKICRFCGRELEPLPPLNISPWIWVAFGIAGALLGAGAVIAYQVIKERRLWSGHQSLALPPKTSLEVEEELMEF